MAGSSNSSVFVQVQGVLNEDWIRSSNKKLTEVLEEIEKIEGVEIRFQRGAHIVSGTVDQLVEVQNLLLEKVRASSSNETTSRNSLKDSEAGGELATDSHDEFNPDKTFVEAEHTHKTQSMTELMVDRDIWEYIESKKQNDVRQLEVVFDAVITKVDDESGVLKLILKTKSRKADDDNFELMLDSLAGLYRETVMSCVIEIAQFQLSDEERELAMEHISAQFSEVLVKKCAYSNDVLFIGPLYDAREARHQFQMVARRLVKGELRTPADKWGHQKYPHEHPPSGINSNDYEEGGLSAFDWHSNRFNGPPYDQQHDVNEKRGFYDENAQKTKQGKDDGLKSDSSKKHLRCAAKKEYASDTVQKLPMASQDPGPKNSKTEDITSSLESQNLERKAHQGKDRIFQASKNNPNDLANSFSTELDETQQQHAVTTDSTVPTKATKKSKKMMSHLSGLPKVAIVKENFGAVCDPSTLNQPSVSSDSRKVETGHQGGKSIVSKDDEKHIKQMSCQQKCSVKFSSDSEASQKVLKRIENAEKKNGLGGLGNRQEERDERVDGNAGELASQETIRNVLENVENSESKVNMKELEEKDAGKHIATDNNLKKIQPSALKEVFPQPADGTIACIIDKGFHLNGCPKSGTIEISVAFEAGIQGADQPEPGRPYRGMKFKAFLPASGDGREVLRLTKSAFAARKLFQIRRNEFEGESDIIIPNGVLFKEAIDQFPDPDYLPNAIDQLKRLTE